MDEPAEKINVTVNSSKAKPAVDTAAVASEPLDSAMTEAINAIDISSDGKLTQLSKKETPQAALVAEQPAGSPELPPAPAAPAEPSSKSEPSSDNLPKFGALQAVIDEHPLFSGAKEPRPKGSGKSPMKKLLMPLIALVVVGAVAYLLIDSGVVRGASHLPFHIFKQPKVATSPTITPPSTSTPTPNIVFVNNKKKAPAASDADVASWKLVNSGKNGFSLKVPNGWSFNNWTSTDYLYAATYSDLTYKAGTPAAIVSGDTTAIDSGPPREFAVEGSPIAQKDTIGGYYDSSPETFTTTAGLQGKKYLHIFSSDGDGYKKGDVVYQYRFEGKKTLVTVNYYVLSDDLDQSAIVDQALKTLSYQ